MVELTRGAVIWADLDPRRGQAGRRLALVVASRLYLRTVTTLAIVVPITTVHRDWPNHVLLRGDRLGLDQPSWAMTEQPRTIDRARVASVLGLVDTTTMQEVDLWLGDFLNL